MDLVRHFLFLFGTRDIDERKDYDIPSSTDGIAWIHLKSRIQHKVHSLLYSGLKHVLVPYFASQRLHGVNYDADIVTLNKILPSINDIELDRWEDLDFIKCIQLCERRLYEVAAIFRLTPDHVDLRSALLSIKETSCYLKTQGGT